MSDRDELHEALVQIAKRDDWTSGECRHCARSALSRLSVQAEPAPSEGELRERIEREWMINGWDNHHNAATCPHCNHGLKETWASLEAKAAELAALRSRLSAQGEPAKDALELDTLRRFIDGNSPIEWERIQPLIERYVQSRLSASGQGIDERGADRLAIAVDRLIEQRIIDSRSPAADALLDYKDGKFYGTTMPTAPASEKGEAVEIVEMPGEAPPVVVPAQPPTPSPLSDAAKPCSICARARDKAIIERCKEALENTSCGGLIGETEAMAFLNSILREIEGAEELRI